MAKILVVDDEESMRNVLRDVLQAAGHIVETADSGEAGLAKFKAAQATQPFNLVFTDLRMPGMNGINLADSIHHADKALAADDETVKETPVILITGTMGEFEGVQAVLPKPSRNKIILAIATAL